MALNEDEEFELLSLERERAMTRQSGPLSHPPAGKDTPLLARPPLEVMARAGGAAMDTIQRGYDLLGEKTAEGLASGVTMRNTNLPPPLNVLPSSTPGRGLRLSPELAAAAGTAVAMTPDIALSFEGGPIKSPERIKTLDSASRGLAQRALGFTKRFLNTPSARRKAAVAAETALEEGVVSISPQRMMDKATALAARSGRAIGEIREAAGPQRLDSIVNDLEALKPEGRGGEWDAVVGRINHAIDTIKGVVAKKTIPAVPEQIVKTGVVDEFGKEITRKIPAKSGFVPPSSLGPIEEAKKLIADTVNWLADNPGKQKQIKKIVGTIESSVEDLLRKAGSDMGAYQKAKRQFGAAKAMQMGLNNELAAQAGNQIFGLKPVIAASGALASGNPLNALATLGATEALYRGGLGGGAKILRALAGPTERKIPSVMMGFGLNRKRKKE